MNPVLFIILFTACCLFVWYIIYTPVVKWYDRRQAEKLKPYEPVAPPTVSDARPFTNVKEAREQWLRDTRKPYDTQL